MGQSKEQHTAKTKNLANNSAITYNELKEKVKKSISKIPKQSYSNYILYSYKTKEIRIHEPKKSTRRRKLKEYTGH